jgi:hypothetical protein
MYPLSTAAPFNDNFINFITSSYVLQLLYDGFCPQEKNQVSNKCLKPDGIEKMNPTGILSSGFTQEQRHMPPSRPSGHNGACSRG